MIPPVVHKSLEITTYGQPGGQIRCDLTNCFGASLTYYVQSLHVNYERKDRQETPADNRDFIISKQTKRIESLIRQARIMDAAFENLAKTLGVTEDLKQYCLERAEKAINVELKAESQRQAKA